MKNQEIDWLLHEKYQGIKSTAFDADCARLTAGVPLAHLIGHVPFLDCTIHLDSNPLIPRPETEYWVEKAIGEIKSFVFARNGAERNDVAIQSFPKEVDCHANARKDDVNVNEATNLRDVIPKILASEVRGPTPYLKILDLCAGSGAIGVAVAKAIPEAAVTFSELDPAHLPTIEKNLKLNLQSNVAVNRYISAEHKYHIIMSDLFLNIPAENKFDFILTNPPYIDVEAHTVDDNVVAHEPHLALFGGVAGMELIARIISRAPNYLTPTGQLWIEHEPAQVDMIATLATQYNFSVITHPDQYGVPRFSVLTMAQ